ncbi:maleylpyruvate isomerase family mycothiol-dependent enzyme [Phycicoccus avicenniae]|uniref:maleylpyruvate isomerase family mycothiol-dependent enzyme n=1 Tax=Phycicoccus avicenniae TaxID=2828860 RepID=UPI003D2916B6
MTVTDLVVAERRDLLALLEDLAPHEWEAPSLCARWRVRDVVAHVLSYEVVGRAGLVSMVRRGRGLPDRMNAAGVEDLATAEPARLVELLREHLEPSGPAALFGGRVGLCDGMIHQQDIRRPLGRPREVPADRLRPVMSFALTAPPVRGAWRARGLRLVATDLDWSFGRGPEVRGPGEAVLMAMAGRRHALDDLDGPGLWRLAGHLPD